MTTQEARKQRLIEIILEKSFKYSEDPPFTLASGRTSPYYFNCKPTTLNPEGMNLIGSLLADMLADADVTGRRGALPFGSRSAGQRPGRPSPGRTGKPIKAFIVRKDVKGHGTRSALEGDVQPGERVVILDDVITTGGSTITAIERAREAGLVIDRVIALIDREEGGRANIEAHVPRVDAVLTRSEIMNHFSGKAPIAS